MARRSYDKMYEEKKEVTEAALAEEPIVESAEAEPVEEEIVEKPKKTKVADDIPATKPFMGVVTGGLNLNVRRTPNGEIVAVIPEGAQVRVLDKLEDGWYRIESPKGFVMSKYIKEK